MAIGPHHGAIAETPVAFTVKAEITSRFLASDSSDLLQGMSLPLRFLTRCKDAKRTNCSCFDVKCLHRSKPCFITLMQSANLSQKLLQTFDENQSSLRFTALGMKSDLDKASFKFDLPMER